MLNLPSTQIPYLRVGIITPSLNMGGAERWFLSLLKNFRAVRPTAIGYVGSIWHPTLADECARSCRLYTANNIGRGECLGSPANVIGRVASECDVLITWGVPDTIKYYAGLPIPVIDVSHNERDFPDQAALCTSAAQGVNHVVGVSECALMAYPAAFRETAGAVIYNGAEVDRITPRRGRKQMRELCNLTDDSKVALFLSRLVQQKHPEVLAHAIMTLPADWTAVFVGEGDLLPDIQKLSERHARNRMLFFPSSVHIGDFFEMSDVWVLPSEYEGHPITLCEAWLAGIPTILSNIGIAQEMRRHHEQPTFYQMERPTDSDELKALLIEAQAGGRKAERVQYARSVAWHNYTASAMAWRWETYLVAVAREWQDNALFTPAKYSTKYRPLRELTQ